MAIRIGIPRALQFHEFYPLWRTFLTELGAELVVSPPTNREILTAGAKVVADVTCLPVKVYAGHVIWLRDNANVDFVYAPAIWSIERNAFQCAKFKALPDILKATIPNCPPLLDIDIDPRGRNLTEEKAFYQMGRRLTWNPLAIRSAWVKAREVLGNYRALMVKEQITYPEALARLYGSEWAAEEWPGGPTLPLTIGLAGHPYCLYDDYANHNLIRRLYSLGLNIITAEMVGLEDAQAGVALTTRERRWHFEYSMSGAAGHFLHRPDVDGVILVLAFACGPDSTMAETITRRAHSLKRSCMSLILDEHGSATGMVTRLEAFIDMLMRQKATTKTTESSPNPTKEAPAPILLREANKPIIGLPRMGTTIVPITSLFRGIGAQVELGPPPSSRTISLGARSSPEFICTPYKQLLGNMIEMLEAGANTLIYLDGLDLCRNSSYHQLMHDALTDLGYKFRLMTFGEIFERGLFAMPEFLRQFVPELTWRDVVREIRLALDKMYVLDEVECRVQYFRPRELTQGGVDKLWDEAIQRIDEAHDSRALQQTKLDVLRKVNRTPIDPTARPVRIATTGEYFAVLDSFYNLDLERELGKLGAEVHRTLMMSHWVRGALILEALGFPRRPEIAKAARPYLRWDISGEGWVTIGQTVIHAQMGFDGVIETMPFTCVPEVVAMNILPKVSREHNIPILTFIFDEQTGRAGMKTRLEAFVDLLYRRRAVREATPRAAPEKELPHLVENFDPVACVSCPVVASCQPGANGLRPSDCNYKDGKRQSESV